MRLIYYFYFFLVDTITVGEQMKKRKRLKLQFKIVLVVLLFLGIFTGINYYQVNQTTIKNVTVFHENTDLLILVNYQYPIKKETEISLVNYKGHQINAVMADDLEQLFKAAAKDKVKLKINNAYRSKAEQTKIYNNSVTQYLNQGFNELEAKRFTEETVSIPGYSEHETGLAIDFSDGLTNYTMWNWLKKNAHQYGFILRYPENKTDITKISFEPWHYRYVGREYAKIITSSGMCLEEYVNKT